jgi:uncharacterized protein (TIGR04222 family)
MDWVTDNPIANLRGPAFLLFYALFIAATLFVGRRALRQRDPSAALPKPPVPAQPDPYEIAYLRGGENEVARTVVFNLLQRGYLQSTPGAVHTGKDKSPEWLERAPKAPDRRHLSPIERCVWDELAIPSSGEGIFRGGLPARIKSQCAEYERRLRDEQLLSSPSLVPVAWQIGLLGLLAIAGLGGYKLLVALSRGRENVFFLFVFGIVGIIALALALRVPRLSARGRAYLKELQLAYTATRQRIERLGRSGADPLLPLLVGLFGVGVLAGTPFDYYHLMFRKSESSGGSCGGGCGSCGSSSDGGGGGCGGCGGGGD